MSTSYADSAQAREWDRRYDAYGREKRSQPEQFHDYEEQTRQLDERRRLLRAEQKAAAVRRMEAVEQIGDFFGYNEVTT